MTGRNPLLPPETRSFLITAGLVLLGCGLCCGLAFLAQYWLEHSDFSLVNVLRAVQAAV